jgi:hypothetical protein
VGWGSGKGLFLGGAGILVGAGVFRRPLPWGWLREGSLRIGGGNAEAEASAYLKGKGKGSGNSNSKGNGALRGRRPLRGVCIPALRWSSRWSVGGWWHLE